MFAKTLFLNLMACSLAAQAAVFYAAPDGQANAPGTKEAPFATLTQARNAARLATNTAPHHIIVRGGRYFDASLLLEPQDSRLTIEAAPGETPILIGGRRLGDWQPDGDGLYAASLPAYGQAGTVGDKTDQITDWDIRLLQVDGRMCPRARLPETGTFEHVTHFDVPWMSSTGGGWKRPPTEEELTTLQYKAGDLSANLEIKNAEITVYHMWDESCVGVIANDSAKAILKLSPATGHPPGAFGVRKYVVWNVREGMKKPGQWYYDRARSRIVYWPLPGQDMTKAEVIVPTRSTILRLKGSSSQPLRDITVKDLVFSVTTVPLITGGFAAAAFDGAISVERTENCFLNHLTVTNAAGHGISGARESDRRLRVEHCDVGPCGAGGIYIGGRNTMIYDNHVHGVGLMFPSAIGIFRGGANNRVSHNEIHDCTYSAINYGGNTNTIEYNLIYDCMKVLHDGAAIYLFAATNCIMRGNLARDFVDLGGYGASAYYLDERSQRCVVERNISINVGWPSHNHMATNNLIRNNLFAYDGDMKITLPRSSDYTVARNVFYATGKIRIEGWNAVTNWSKNIFFSGTNRIERVTLNQYTQKETLEGAPEGSVTDDPLFQNWREADFGFEENSPARLLGIDPVDSHIAGRVKR
jgi:hypothetical protein